ncbi:helix-turn-helix transcriptional regulator [Gallaecimonas pentaromativorans]|uniref:Helix-turn-helix protein n=1 Tax=Gallaecimonas pentaromativorans TaxID=584787 RepID=A0A3N1P9G9_9GAMM|nr:helix-turn-helix transcriptional regulator [Gallaecimonas pentaromativorans]MED5526230.1 helix-turn-helix transcriptional regulator [Pseudomonadota bacterium]ROQ24378.1 hypothetical protein EDC28_107261 [Gallaecimonas pentaromativorans]
MNFEFSAFVKAKRRTLGLSQEEFAHHLSCRREAFARLDAVTISRWERGVTTPSLYRQAQIIAAVGDDPLKTLCDSDDQEAKELADAFLLREPWTRLRAFFYRYRVADHLKVGVDMSEDDPEEFERFQSWIGSCDKSDIMIQACLRLNREGQISHQLIRHHDLLLAHMVMVPIKKSARDAIATNASDYFKNLTASQQPDANAPCYLLVTHAGGLCDSQLERCLRKLMNCITHSSHIHGVIWRGSRGDADALCNVLGVEFIGRSDETGHYYLLERERLASQLAAALLGKADDN